MKKARSSTSQLKWSGNQNTVSSARRWGTNAMEKTPKLPRNGVLKAGESTCDHTRGSERRRQYKIAKAREDLIKAHEALLLDLMNVQIIGRVKRCTEKVIQLNSMEEQTLHQRANLDWLKMGDVNNSFFHATLKSKAKQTQFQTLIKEDGTIINSQQDLKEEFSIIMRE
ncbi:unnamed protein product [Vicia faba]|uniref:Uncharacterized protein n=1 Tax=Vicia faba TaxID=3906 RepID=A0AAV1ALR6_VICFA|nr:unnamed protein product [Vicia faba]